MTDDILMGNINALPAVAVENDEQSLEQHSSITERTKIIGRSVLRYCLEKPVESAIVNPYRRLKAYEPQSLLGAIGKGLLIGIPETGADYGSTVVQTFRDAGEIVRLQNGNVLEDRDGQSFSDRFGSKLTRAKLALWYTAFGGYQVADDALTYPLYLHLESQDRIGITGAYGVTALATVALATAMAVGQRKIEAHKADLRGVATVPALVSDPIRRIADASFNSAPWQVALVANRSREEINKVPLISNGMIAKCAISYAGVNTLVYAFSEGLPVGEWTGFGLMLAAISTAGGVGSHTREFLNNRKKVS